MKLFPIVSLLLGTAAFAFVPLSELGAPHNNTVLHPGQKFTAQIIEPGIPGYCIQVGIALSLAFCYDGVCPPPSECLDDVLYAGPWNPTLHGDRYYQNFTLQVPEYVSIGPSLFTVTHLCLLGAGPTPVLEFLNVSITMKSA